MKLDASRTIYHIRYYMVIKSHAELCKSNRSMDAVTALDPACHAATTSAVSMSFIITPP